MNALDEGEWELDFVASRIVVDIVGDAGFVRGIEDDQVHGVLADSPPGTNAQRPTGKVMNDCC